MKTLVRPRRDFQALQQRRLQAAKLFRAGETLAFVARALHASRQSASRWYQAWKRGGLAALRAAGRAGRKPKLHRRQLEQVERLLCQGARAHGFGTDLWTLPRVAAVIERHTGVRYHPGHVWKILGAMNWSLQRPARQARERNEDAVRQWVRERWPAVKKRSAPPGLDPLPGRERCLRAALGPPQLGAARPDAEADPRLQLGKNLGGGGPGLPLGREALPFVFPDPAGQLRRRKPDRLPETAATPLPRPASHLGVGRPARPQEPDHEGLPLEPARLAERGTAARLRARPQPGRAAGGQYQGPGTRQSLVGEPRRSRHRLEPGPGPGPPVPATLVCLPRPRRTFFF